MCRITERALLLAAAVPTVLSFLLSTLKPRRRGFVRSISDTCSLSVNYINIRSGARRLSSNTILCFVPSRMYRVQPELCKIRPHGIYTRLTWETFLWFCVLRPGWIDRHLSKSRSCFCWLTFWVSETDNMEAVGLKKKRCCKRNLLFVCLEILLGTLHPWASE